MATQVGSSTTHGPRYFHVTFVEERRQTQESVKIKAKVRVEADKTAIDQRGRVYHLVCETPSPDGNEIPLGTLVTKRLNTYTQQNTVSTAQIETRCIEIVSINPKAENLINAQLQTETVQNFFFKLTRAQAMNSGINKKNIRSSVEQISTSLTPRHRGGMDLTIPDQEMIDWDNIEKQKLKEIFKEDLKQERNLTEAEIQRVNDNVERLFIISAQLIKEKAEFDREKEAFRMRTKGKGSEGSSQASEAEIQSQRMALEKKELDLTKRDEIVIDKEKNLERREQELSRREKALAENESKRGDLLTQNIARLEALKARTTKLSSSSTGPVDVQQTSETAQLLLNKFRIKPPGSGT